ncbi:MAG: hypothetical protein K6A30_04560 [Lachnospiraceae bacterium]|nr:hypothetical protein [Lachnospiraceae bacterium]
MKLDMMKKTLAVALVSAVCVGTMPVQVLAADGTQAVATPASETGKQDATPEEEKEVNYTKVLNEYKDYTIIGRHVDSDCHDNGSVQYEEGYIESVNDNAKLIDAKAEKVTYNKDYWNKVAENAKKSQDEKVIDLDKEYADNKERTFEKIIEIMVGEANSEYGHMEYGNNSKDWQHCSGGWVGDSTYVFVTLSDRELHVTNCHGALNLGTIIAPNGKIVVDSCENAMRLIADTITNHAQSHLVGVPEVKETPTTTQDATPAKNPTPTTEIPENPTPLNPTPSEKPSETPSTSEVPSEEPTETPSTTEVPSEEPSNQENPSEETVTPIEDPEVPLAPAESKKTEVTKDTTKTIVIEEEPTPLSENPLTGDAGVGTWGGMAILSLLGLIFSGKKIK